MTAFSAAFADMKLVKTRQVAQLIFEIPIEEFDAAYEVLGGMPVPSKERWFGIAALAEEARATPRQDTGSQSPPDGAKRSWRDLDPTTQAAMRCNEMGFEAFLKEEREDDWREAVDAADCVRMICGVASRKEISTHHKARVIWHQLDSQYIAWLLGERVGA